MTIIYIPVKVTWKRIDTETKICTYLEGDIKK